MPRRSSTANPSPIRTIWTTPFYRAAFISVFVAGIGVSITSPQLALFLVNDLGATTPVAGLYYLVNLAAPLAGYLIGRLSDRRPERLVLYRICVLIGALGWVAMAFATQIWMPFLIGAVALSIGGTSMSILFAAARDDMTRHATPGGDQIIAMLRMGFSGGWIIGPVIGAWFGAEFGLRPLLLTTAALTASQAILIGRHRVLRYLRPTQASGTSPAETATASSRRRAQLPLWIFTACGVLVMSGDMIRFAYLPLYMVNELGVSATVYGVVIAIQPVLEFVLMPLFASIAVRTGAIRMIIIGSTAGVLAYVTFTLSRGTIGIVIGQIFMSALLAAIAGLGVTVAQQLYPEGVGLASSVFMSSIMLASGLGGALGALGVTLLGVPHVFVIPATLAFFGVIGLIVVARRYQPSDDVFARYNTPEVNTPEVNTLEVNSLEVDLPPTCSHA